MAAEMDVRDAKVWFWRFKTEAATRVRALQKVERERLREANVFRRERDDKLRDAKGKGMMMMMICVRVARGGAFLITACAFCRRSPPVLIVCV